MTPGRVRHFQPALYSYKTAYTMKIYADGWHSRLKTGTDLGAAAVVSENANIGGFPDYWRKSLPSDPTPSKTRAEFTALILAFTAILERQPSLDKYPPLDVTILTHSQYAIDCLTKYAFIWALRDWKTADGCDIVNRDLIEEAFRLQGRVLPLVDLKWECIPWNENTLSDKVCRMDLEEQERYHISLGSPSPSSTV